MLNKQSYAGIGRELQITPQQFSDWIKKRRPIPNERLKALSDYFGVDENVLVDEQQYVRPLTPISKIDIQMLLLEKAATSGSAYPGSPEPDEPLDADVYKEKMDKLRKEKARQIRIDRMSSALQQEDEQINRILDTVLEKIESGKAGELEDALSGRKQ